MWNQASASAAAAGGGSASGSIGASGSIHSSAGPHTTGSSATHTRTNSMTHNTAAHRRVAGINQQQHASSPSGPSYPRPFANVAFPGTISAPRSAAAPNTPSAPPKSLQRLPILTNHTPTSIAKLAFPPHTTIFWHRLRPVISDPCLCRTAPLPAAPFAAGLSAGAPCRPRRSLAAAVRGRPPHFRNRSHADARARI